ncbi:hypothetical protein [Rhodococcus sp. HNM0569]|uniref:hypothetical protein n=1 Tax=Rhodococcus sp. HNM0569 TaxID=2716340 RepID=UPI00146A9E59|nr:hypothetical protein [Rhodococcus sp. HNM0569]NLU82688.1 hypothetical protein [Rhodococcus sp. HNM0569]
MIVPVLVDSSALPSLGAFGVGDHLSSPLLWSARLSPQYRFLAEGWQLPVRCGVPGYGVCTAAGGTLGITIRIVDPVEVREGDSILLDAPLSATPWVDGPVTSGVVTRIRLVEVVVGSGDDADGHVTVWSTPGPIPSTAALTDIDSAPSDLTGERVQPATISTGSC